MVRVVPPAQLWPSPVPPLPSASAQTRLEVQRAEAFRDLAALTHEPAAAGVDIRLEIHIGPVAATILSLARERQVDLLVLSRQGETGSTRWGWGTVAEKIVRHATVPTLLLPASERDTLRLPLESGRPLHVLIALDGFNQGVRDRVSRAGCISALQGLPGCALLV